MSNPENDFVVYCADIGTELDGQKNFAWVCSEAEENKKYEDENTLETLGKSLVVNISKKIAIGFECPLYFDMHPENSRIVTKGRIFGNDNKVDEINEGDRAWTASAGAPVLVTGLAQTTWLFNYLYTEMNKEIKINKEIKLPKIFIMDSWEEFVKAKSGIFIWEAFVSNKNKKKPGEKKNTYEKKYKDPAEHIVDAIIGLIVFLKKYITNDSKNNVDIEDTINRFKEFLKEEDEKNTVDLKNKAYTSKAIARLNAFLEKNKTNDPNVPQDSTKDYFSIIGSVLLRTGWSKDEDILNKNCIVIKPSINDIQK